MPALKSKMKVCRVPGCHRRHSATMVMCLEHWLLVPARVRAKVWREFHQAPGSREHVAAVMEALHSVGASIRPEEVTHGDEPADLAGD